MQTIGKTRRSTTPREVRGVLHRLDAGRFTHGRFEPPPDLGDRIEHFWRVGWDLAGLPPQRQETLPHPNVHIVIEPGSAAAWGVHGGRWTRMLEGRSWAFGIKFRPGAFRALLGRSVASLADRSMPIEGLFGDDAERLAAAVRAAGGDEQAVAQAVEEAAHFLRQRLPPADERSLLAGRIVDGIADDRELHTAQQVADRFGLGLRALQRLFQDHVGASPKWVINRYRMHEAVARVQAGQPVSWAALAQELGYFDQAHFIADFRKLVGRTPADYARALPRG